MATENKMIGWGMSRVKSRKIVWHLYLETEYVPLPGVPYPLDVAVDEKSFVKSGTRLRWSPETTRWLKDPKRFTGSVQWSSVHPIKKP